MITILTSWSKVLLEKLIVTHLVKKLFVFHDTHRFISLPTGLMAASGLEKKTSMLKLKISGSIISWFHNEFLIRTSQRS